jgi:hypothetical protein
MPDKKCATCGSANCPCPVCHGNPKRYLGGIHAGKGDPNTGSVKCNACGRLSSRA